MSLSVPARSTTTAREAPSGRGLGVIIRIQAHVLGREVGRPEAGRRAAFFENDDDARVAVRRQRLGDSIGVEIDRAAPLVEQDAVEMKRDFRRIEPNARIARSRDDAAPIRIGPGDRRFHERTVGDRFRHLPSVVL